MIRKKQKKVKKYSRQHRKAKQKLTGIGYKGQIKIAKTELNFREALTDLVKNKEHYILNSDFEFFDELRTLVLKSSPAEQSSFARRISRLGAVTLVIISGILLNSQSADASTSLTDLFIVADGVDKQRFNRFLKSLEAGVGTEIKFGIMDKQEFD